MAPRLTDGAALLVAGFGSPGEPGQTTSAVHALGLIGETFLTSGAPWMVRRLSPAAADRSAPSRASLKRHLDELVHAQVRVAVLVATGEITTVDHEPALVTGLLHRDYPEDATLPLPWIGERLRQVRAEKLLVVVSATGEWSRSADAWLAPLRTDKDNHVIAVHATQNGCPLVGALLAGLCGEALDAETGTVTLRSISQHLARRVPDVALQASSSSETLSTVPPLGGLGDVRLSRLAHAGTARAGRPHASQDDEDLTGVVLPGRFRVERPLARGSFGMVLRARQLTIERDVAVKVLPAGVDPASDDGRLFVHEVQSVGRIDHPNVVRIYQADVTPDGRLFFAMELLVGRDLQQIVQDEGCLEPDRAVALTLQLLDGLAAVHDAGLVHADVKPANAFVTTGRDGERLVLIDFGLARLKPPGQPAESAGGTPAYMAPEQLRNGRVDARSDLFSAALVLVTLLCGWRRERPDQLVPPLDDLPDPALAPVLARALHVDPAERFQSVSDFSDALAGREPGTSRQIRNARPPFRHLASLTERDAGRMYGRERDLATLTDHVLYQRAVIYTAPSGVGKTSLLRAGLVPRLEALGIRPVYLSCRAGALGALATTIWPGALTVAEGISGWYQQRGGKMVIIFDQLEAVLSDAAVPEDVIAEALAFDRWPRDADVAVVLSVREDFLARLISRSQRLAQGLPIVRLAPLDLDGARAAIVGPLAESRLAIAPDLLDVLLADLQAGAASLGAEMGWGQTAAVYPPHLQLACTALYEALGAGEALLTLAHYRRLGGLDAVVGEHLDRVLDTELDEETAIAARDLFLALVSAAQTRAFRGEAELLELLGARHGKSRIANLLETLHARGLVVRLRASSGEPGWELVHDSLVPRVLAWIDRRDLARRSAIELVRYHLRRSRPEAPSLLGRAELRELKPHRDAIAEMDGEWTRRGDGGGLTPTRLVEASRQALRRRALVLAGSILAVLAVGGTVAYRVIKDEEIARRDRSWRDRDMGLFALELTAFDWDPVARKTIQVPLESLPRLKWRLFDPDVDDRDAPGRPVADGLVGPVTREIGREHVEARGGAAFLVLAGRGRGDETCAPSIVRLKALPGYARRLRDEAVFRVQVPTCQASRADMIEIPAGPFLQGGVGDPPSTVQAQYPDSSHTMLVELATFFIDRTEVTNASFAAFATMADLHDIAMPTYPKVREFKNAAEPDKPVAGLAWAEARAYCRFLGKELPTSEQWEKSMRGGIMLPGNVLNPAPLRNLPWARRIEPVPARLKDTGHSPAAVGATPGDTSPYGVVDLAGNVQEWTDSLAMGQGGPGFRVARGGDWDEVSSEDLVDFMAIENPKPAGTKVFILGFRCARQEP